MRRASTITTRKTSMSPEPQAMTTWAMSSPTGAMRTPKRRFTRLIQPSADSSSPPLLGTSAALKGYLSLNPILFRRPVNTEVTGTPVRKNVRAHTPMSASTSGITRIHQRSARRIFTSLCFTRHTTDTTSTRLENTTAVGFMA